MDSAELRLLLERCGSYPAIEAAAASGELHQLLPVELFEHIGIVYRRLEGVADPHCPGIAELRLTVLLHEMSPNSLPLRKEESALRAIVRELGPMSRAAA